MVHLLLKFLSHLSPAKVILNVQLTIIIRNDIHNSFKVKSAPTVSRRMPKKHSTSSGSTIKFSSPLP